ATGRRGRPATGEARTREADATVPAAGHLDDGAEAEPHTAEEVGVRAPVKANGGRHRPEGLAGGANELEGHVRKPGGGRGDQAGRDRVVECRRSDEEAGGDPLSGPLGPGDERNVGVAHHSPWIGARPQSLKAPLRWGGAGACS